MCIGSYFLLFFLCFLMWFVDRLFIWLFNHLDSFGEQVGGYAINYKVPKGNFTFLTVRPLTVQRGRGLRSGFRPQPRARLAVSTEFAKTFEIASQVLF